MASVILEIAETTQPKLLKSCMVLGFPLTVSVVYLAGLLHLRQYKRNGESAINVCLMFSDSGRRVIKNTTYKNYYCCCINSVTLIQ